MKRKYNFCTKNCLSIILSLILAVFIVCNSVSAIDCPVGKWTCSNGIECIDLTSRCNSIVDCGDGSDEGTSCNSTCTIDEFRCATVDQCIKKEYICDHDNDCRDASDERNCSYAACSSTQFTCGNKRCINMKYVCDGDNDCGDKSDENHCASRNCPPNMVPCNTTTTCVAIDSLCNGIRDCPDGSDENTRCSNLRCASLSCLHSCHQSPSGGICKCPNGQILSPSDNRTCVDIDECEMWDECDQICVNTLNSYRCECSSNYTLLQNGYCRSVISDQARVLFSLGNKIYETDQEGRNVRLVFNNDDIEITSFDYNFKSKNFYFADQKNNKIYRGIYDQSGPFRTVQVLNNILGPFSLAVDWLTGNVYLSQQSLSRIDIFSSDGQNRTDLLTTDLFSPTSIAVDSSLNFLFFTDSGNPGNKLQPPKIERVFMDGTDRHVIVSSKLLQPQAITLDIIKKRIFWIDVKYDHLESCDYYGSKRFIIASGSSNLPHSISIDIFETTIFYADTTKLAIMKLKRHSVTSPANITYHYKFNDDNKSLPKHVRVYHSTKQFNSRQNPCGLNNGGCEHFCLLSHGNSGFRCKCKTGFELGRDLRTCSRAISSLYLSQTKSIRGISLSPTIITETRTPIIMPKIGGVRAIEVDCANNVTFFYDPVRRAIFQNKLSDLQTLEESEVLIPNDISYVESIAYDWISKNLYFTNLGKISVVRLAQPKQRRDIVFEAQIFALAVDPNAGYLFYSTLSRPARVVRTYLDGTSPKIIAQQGLSLPYAIALDYQTKKIYWADAHLRKVQYSDYNGNNTRILQLPRLAMPTSMAVYKNDLFYADFQLRTISKTYKTYGTTSTLIRANMNSFYQIKVVANDLQTTIDNHPCSRQNGDCTHFCFAVASNDTRYPITRHCGCPFGLRLDTDMASCIANPEERSENLCLAPNFFKCANDRCIRSQDRCDSVNDCLDFSDELNCPTFFCANDQFKCRNGTCIPISKRCDRRLDCADFSDEMLCPQLNCNRNQFKCANGSCIPLAWKCDSENDCGDSSDEANCTSGQCDPLTQFECHGQAGRCISKSYVCDGENDCQNNYDEENCPAFTCPPGQFKCALDNICINQTRVCDSTYDCPSFSDEQNCRFTTQVRTCRQNEFQCSSSPLNCIPRTWVCDGHADCPNGLDEPRTCPANQNCPIGSFRCNNTRCIPDAWRCDGDNDCGDNSDEMQNCQALPFRCNNDQTRCEGIFNMCINTTQICNGIIECPEGSDEGPFCSRDDCSIQNGGCSHLCRQSPMGALCICPRGYATTNETQYKKCEDIDECLDESSCSQMCANTRGGFNCACMPGYVRSQGKLCKAITRNFAKVFVTNGNSLMMADLDGKSVRNILSENRESMNYVTAFDFHNRTGRVYWADRGSHAIWSCLENGTGLVKVISSGVSMVEALAVDWVSQNLYWTDYVMEHVAVSRLDGSRRKILFSVNVTNPRGLVLDPRRGVRLMFWSDWGRLPRIERANMDGTERRAIITSKLYWPNGLTLDLPRQRLYFADAHLDFIESCDYNGNNRKQILANTLSMHQPHSLSFFEENLFWVDRGHRALMRTSRFTALNVTVMSGLGSRALTVKVVHDLLQPQEENPCVMASCEHLCLLSRNRTTGYRCECQIGYKKDADNENRCNLDDSEFLIILDENLIGGVRIMPNDTVSMDVTSVVDSDSTDSVISDLSALSSFAHDSGSFLWDRLVPVNDISFGYDFTYDPRSQQIFYLQHNRSTYSLAIHTVRFDGSSRQVFHSSDQELFHSPFCLDFHAPSRNLIVANLFHSFIEAINIDNNNRATIYSNSDNQLGVGYPIRLTVSTLESEIYWIDAGLGAVPKKIAAVRLDASEPRIIIKDDLNQPGSIFYHASSRRIFWTDLGKKTIESASVLVNSPLDRRTIVSDAEEPYALTIWDVNDESSILYYSDRVMEQLVAFNLKTSEKRVIKSNVPNIMHLQIYNKPKIYNSPCSTNNGGCQQICLPNNSGRVCRCSNGLRVQSDGSCVSYKEFILFTSSSYLRGIPFEAAKNEQEALPVIGGVDVTGSDFDYKSRSILWIEGKSSVRMLTINDTWSPVAADRSLEFIKKTTLFELDSPKGTLMDLSMDWVNNLLYYSYFEAPNSYVKVTNFPRIEYHFNLFTSNLHKPSLLAVDPIRRYLYWIDQGQFPRLVRAWLDGSNQTVLINQGLGAPTDLFVDRTNGDVYWSDNIKDTIEKCGWDGSGRKVMRSTGLPSTKGLWLQEGVMYYVDSRLKGVYSVDVSSMNTSMARPVLIKQIKSDDLNGLLLFTEKSQPPNPSSVCANGRSLCDQICFEMPDGLARTSTCACAIGKLDSNSRTCNRPNEYLIFAMENEIRSLNLPLATNTDTISAAGAGMPWKPITGLNKSIGIDFDFKDNKIFFSDIREKKISSFLVTSENPELRNILSQNTSIISKPEGIAYDWVTDTVFYTDNDLNQVIRYDIQTQHRYLIGYSQSPRAIAVHPCQGLLFWTDIGSRPMIARSSLVGANYRPIITTNIKWPNGLTIDFTTSRIFWADSYYNKIESADFDGNFRQPLSTAVHPFAITVYGHFIYWSEWSTNSIYRAEKYQGSNTLALVQGLPKRPMDLQIWSEQRQKCTYSPCLVYNGGCSHICSVAQPGNRTECRCPYGMRLRLSNNYKTCTPIQSPACNATQFTCSNGQCIEKRFVCDGARHCSDGSDETVNFCTYHRCEASEFRCRNGRCLPQMERCNRVDECGDGSDETGCVYPQCDGISEFQCRNFRCIPLVKRCDGVVDCQDGNSTDEVGCPVRECDPLSSLNIKCPNTNVCIMRRWLCDGDNDCGDASDENRLFCNSVPCGAGEFRCRDNKCIPYNWFCDGDRDCSSGEDEPTNQCRTGNFTCPADFFKCDSGRCISRTYVCDGDRDCADNSDEDERHNCLDRDCQANEFKCESGVRGRNNTKCIRAGQVCDGFPSCVNAEDELKNCTRRECQRGEFTCSNGLCINQNYICDHDNDCGDGSDEPHNCTFTPCSSSQFKCDNQRCIPASYKCNQRNDCFDNSDERNCPSANDPPTNCTVGQFQCANKACIQLDYVCNNRRDCSDNSDEAGCGVNECASPILNRCDHICQNTLTSFRCSCNPGYKLFNRYNCIDINECRETPYVCEQLCENTSGSYNCKCAPGYEKSAQNPDKCKLIGPKAEANLLFSNNYYLRNISLDSLTYSLIKEGFGEARGIAYDYNDSRVFILDGVNQELISLKLNLSQSSSVVTETKVLARNLGRDLRSLVFDWVTRKLYFLTRNQLCVCDEDGNSIRSLLGSEVLQEGGSLVIDPFMGLIFFSDWKFPAYIGRVDMDGRNFKKIVSEDMGSPIGMTIDLVTQRVWWTDTHLKKIEFCGYNGTKRYRAIDSDVTAYPWAVAFFEGRLFWSDRGSDSIYSANALNGSTRQVVKENTVHSVWAIVIYHYSLQVKGNNPCETNNGGCSHLCLISGRNSTETIQSFRCECPTSYTMTADGKTCIANCSDWHFRCGLPEERCVPFYWRCDGEVDCKDGSDERDCPAPRYCPIGQRQCNNTNCVSTLQVCNGRNDCQDNSDELDCPEGCPPGRFQCPISKRCISNNQVCDGRNDCQDQAISDEVNCLNRTCPAGKFTCQSGHCIDQAYFCDEEFDCADRSDEPAYTCRNRQCPSGWTRCRDSYKCINTKQMCDGHQDCPAGDDEQADRCPTCHPTGDFKCSNNRCIMLSLRCNNIDDCGDNSDESAFLCDHLPPRKCSESEFKCANNNCIPGHWRCDHDNDCGDNSDEQGCQAFDCGSNKWKCNSGHCIQVTQKCDTVRNCLDYSDESDCLPRLPNGRYCANSSFECSNHVCTRLSYQCDGDNDCGDSSDESLAHCARFNCTAANDRFRCANGFCIHASAVCNGFHDCSDHSDEDFSTDGPCHRAPTECQDGQFKCALSHKCIPVEFLCDRDLDCGETDKSDEIGCYNNGTEAGLDGGTCQTNGSVVCEHVCTDFSNLNGFFCSCHKGFVIQKASNVSQLSHACTDIDECSLYSMNNCTQECLNVKGSYKCSCGVGYVNSRGDGSVCEVVGEDAVVLLAYGGEIRQIRPNGLGFVYSGIIENEQLVLAMDVDPVDRYFYWIDETSQKIKRSYIPNSLSALGHAQSLESLGTSVENDNWLTALSIDWIAKNIYFADSKHEAILVARSDGRYPKILITENAEIVYSLVVNPLIGMLFWIDTGTNPKIMAAWLNGQNQKVLVNTNLDHPTGLAIDFYKNGRLYWCDQKNNFIESINSDGSDRVRIYHNGLERPYRIDVFGSHIYWLSQDRGSVNRIDKFGRGGMINLVRNLDLAEDVKIFHSSKAPAIKDNPCLKSNCSHLCLLKPSNEFECACPTGTSFFQNDIYTCNSGLKRSLERPLACNCINCWCFYNEVGVHFKCHTGWQGSLCEINAENKALIGTITGISKVLVPILVIVLIACMLAFVYHKKKNISDIYINSKISRILSMIRSKSTTVDERGTSTLTNNPELNAELATSVSTPSSTSGSSFGLLNPAFFKSSAATSRYSDPTAESYSELMMSDVKLKESNNNALEDIEPIVVENTNSTNIFSTNVEKEKESKTKKKKKTNYIFPKNSGQEQFDPSSKESFNDTETLVEQSKQYEY